MGPSDQVAHGALDHTELAALGLQPELMHDCSSNLNPFGPPVGVRAALAALNPAPYPDRSCYRLRMVLAEHHRCEVGALLPGNGANELIHLLVRALLQPGDVVLVIGPTYGEYAHASRLMGARVVEVTALWSGPDMSELIRYQDLVGADPVDRCASNQHITGEFTADQALPAVFSRIIERTRPRLIWLCSPNNPTGVALAPEVIAILADTCARYGGYLILDQSYHALQRLEETGPQLETQPPNLIALYSLTKAYALAGLRLGYVLATPELVARMAHYQPAWSVNSAAQAAGLAALADTGFLARTVPQLWAASDSLYAGLQGLGLMVWRAALPFMLVRTGHGATTRAALLQRGYVVRDCSSFGLPQWVRVAPQHPDVNTALLAAWKALR